MIGSACATPEPIRIIEPLPLPARPVLPKITFAEAREIPAALWEKIVKRDLMRRQYAEQLETVIKSTHKNGPQ